MTGYIVMIWRVDTDKMMTAEDEDGRIHVPVFLTREDATEAAERSDIDNFWIKEITISW